MKSQNDWTVKDITFLAILSAALLLASSLVMPIVMFTQFFALRQLFAALFFAPATVLALYRVPRAGALTLLGLFTGAALGFMSLVMLINNVLGAVITEAVVLLLFRGYSSRAAKLLAATIYMPITLPVTFFYNAIIKHKTLMEQFGDQIFLAFLFVGGVFVLSYVGALIGFRVAEELKRAGKWKV